MEWKSVGEKDISISLDTVAESLNKDDVTHKCNQGTDPFSITLPNGDTLSMILSPIPASTAVVGMSSPCEQDIIIPDPCIDTRDLLDFKLLSNESPHFTQTVPDHLFDSLKHYIHPEISSIDQLTYKQWCSLLKESIITEDMLHSLVISLHTPSFCKAVVEVYYPQWQKEGRRDLINALQIPATMHLTNQERGEWASELFVLWKDPLIVTQLLKEF